MSDTNATEAVSHKIITKRGKLPVCEVTVRSSVANAVDRQRDDYQEILQDHAFGIDRKALQRARAELSKIINGSPLHAGGSFLFVASA